MQEKRICEKTICLAFDNNNEKSLQINFLDALSSLYQNITDNVYYCTTNEDIKYEIDCIDELIDITINSDNDYIYFYKNDTLFSKILDGLKSKIEKEIS